MKYVFLLGRILFSAIFILKSFEHFSPKMIDHAASMGVPMPSILVPLAGIVALLGGLSVLLGYRARVGAWLLVVFLVSCAFAMHRFWQAENPMTGMMQHYCFFKNISMLGAALMITYFGAGPLAFDKHKKV